VVLWAWAVMVVAGAEFANLSEGWRRAMRPSGRALPTGGYGVVLAAAACCTVVVLAGGALCARPFVRFLSDGGWAKLRSRVIRSAALSVATVCLFVAMRVWSGHLDSHQRDGGYLPYGLLALAAGSVVWWAAVASQAPWFLGGTPPGTPGAVAPPMLVAVGVVMALAAVTAAAGAARVATCRARLT
jgi:hypothetical protein